jgi:hypothetical protein
MSSWLFIAKRVLTQIAARVGIILINRAVLLHNTLFKTR